VTVTGPDFIALQVRDLDSAAAFYEDRLGLRRAPRSARPTQSCSPPRLSRSPCVTRCPA
jgi:catechol-2,3-dioxygenase